MVTNPSLSEITNDSVNFYTHFTASLGCKLFLWEKVGYIFEIGDTSHILFRDTMNYGVRAGEQPIKVSNNWYIWHINDENFTNVGKLKGKNKKAEIGIVVSPYDIVDRIKGSKYKFVYPNFEYKDYCQSD